MRSALLAWAALAPAAWASTGAAEPPPTPVAECRELDAGLALHIDNDLLAGARHDADYTGGMALHWTPSGQSPRAVPHRLHWGLDRLVGVADRGGCRSHVWQLGLYSLTPDSLRSPVPLFDDRPFASALVLGTSAVWDGVHERVAWQSMLQLGILGLDAARSVHAALHRLVDDEDPQGYQYQISDGGELTARYLIARHRLFGERLLRGETLQLKSTAALSAGWLTEASLGWSARWGRIATPWQSFTPELADYLPTPAPVMGPPAAELYAFAGARVKLRAYNALNQGQFRESVHVLHTRELERWLAEVWLGVQWAPVPEWEFTYTIRAQTPELRHEPGRRSLFWAGIAVTHRF